ncbi:hypothetical protein LEMLEM_LOCUS9588 [Lemmus lemmus]
MENRRLGQPFQSFGIVAPYATWLARCLLLVLSLPALYNHPC